MEKQEQMFGSEPRNLIVSKNENTKRQLSFKTLLDRFYLKNAVIPRTEVDGKGQAQQGTFDS